MWRQLIWWACALLVYVDKFNKEKPQQRVTKGQRALRWEKWTHTDVWHATTQQFRTESHTKGVEALRDAAGYFTDAKSIFDGRGCLRAF